jgi:aldehyde:ferredoxin oxidoreductase
MFDNSAQAEYGGQKAHHQFLTELLNGIAEGKSVLSEGLGRAADKLGPAAVAIYNNLYPANGYTKHHIECVGAALHWATETRDPYSSCHDYSFALGPSASLAAHFGVPGGDISASGGTFYGSGNVYDRRELQTAWVQNNQSLKNSLPMCEYAATPNVFYHPPDMDISIFQSQIMSAVTGVDMDVDKLWEAADSIMTLRRAVMVLREGRRRDDDTLAKYWFERVGGGAESLAGPLDRTQFEALKDRYYTLRGWDVKNGWPTRARLESLGMKPVADKLASSGKLG